MSEFTAMPDAGGRDDFESTCTHCGEKAADFEDDRDAEECQECGCAGSFVVLFESEPAWMTMGKRCERDECVTCGAYHGETFG